LYSPEKISPSKIIDTGRVFDYIHPKRAYRMYYPSAWEVGDINGKATDVLFSDISGEYVSVHIVKKEFGESFRNWFGRVAKGQKFSDLLTTQNSFKQEVIVRKDRLVAYIEDDVQVFVLIYNPRQQQQIPFRHVIEMMVQSFRLENSIDVLPEQTTLPGVNTSTLEEIGEIDISTSTLLE